MSGGVDSSVAALMLKGDGHDVVGLTMDIAPGTEHGVFGQGARASRRCGVAAARDAARVAAALGIQHHVLPMRPIFESAVMEPFAAEYARGRTPNPCVRCNRLVKFGELLSRAEAMGADRLATGHHAVIRSGAHGLSLARPVDEAKDQTYFLFRLTQTELRRALMPVGSLSKSRVRGLARDAGLDVAERPESQDVCFIPGGGTRRFLEEWAPTAVEPGPILDRAGRVIGEHRGIGLYTVGQRSGLGLSRSHPTYVVGIDAQRNALVVGGEHDLVSASLTARDLSWVAGAPPDRVFRASAKIRYSAPAAACEVECEGGEARIVFDEPVRAVAPGQAVVLYDRDVVLGGGTIQGPR